MATARVALLLAGQRPTQRRGIELHVRRVDGGQVSSALLQSVTRGDVVRLGSPLGDRLALDRQASGDLLLIAGGTGLAPLRSVIEQVSRETVPRRVDLFVGAPKASDATSRTSAPSRRSRRFS